MAELQRQEYAALLGLLQPGQAATIFEGRVKSINDVNLQIADWLAERKRVEEAYAAGLSRLVARHEQGSFSMGVFQIPWSNLVTHTAALSEAHLLLAKRITDDVEQPLRQYATSNPNMRGLNGAEESLREMAKEFEESQRKAQKAQGRGKADTSGFEASSLQWDTQAPFSFEQLQTADEARVAHLQSVLTQFATHEVDAIERSRTGAENALNTLLNIDPTEEISTFVARVSQSATNAVPSRTSGIRPTTAGDVESPSADLGTSTGGPSDRRSSLASGVNGAPPVPEPRKKSRLSGLKRLGTVITRTGKDKDVKDDKASTKETEKAKRRNPLRRGSSLPQGVSPNDSSADLRMQDTRNESAADPGRNTLPPIPTGETSLLDSPNELPTTIAPAPDTTGNAVNGERASQPFSTIPEEPVQNTSSSTTYSPPSSSLSAIEQAQREANLGNDEDSSPFKVDIRREPIQEEGSDAALTSIGLPPQRRQQASTRGRRDVRNTVFIPNSPPTGSENTDMFGSAAVGGALGGAALGGASMLAMRPGQSFLPTTSSSMSGDEHRGTDTQSIRSATSTSVAAPARHPELTGAGLQASIIETVSMTLSSGSVIRGSVLGEIALAHPSSSNETPTIRLTNFSSLEKVAPNPAFITPSTSREGDYSVFSTAISSSTPTVGFKYQVHLDESNTLSHAPLLISPVWKVEDKQTSVIVNYTSNPAYAYPVSTLSNLTITLSLDAASARPSSCLSKPSGAFSRERGIIVWRLGSVDLAAAEGGKLLARFVTDAPATPGSIDAKFEIASEINSSATGLGVALLTSASAADPFADADEEESQEKSIVVRKRVVTGKYTAS